MARNKTFFLIDRKSGSAGMPRPISYAVFCLKKNIAPATAHSFAKLALGLAHDIVSYTDLATLALALLVIAMETTTGNDFYTLSLHDALPIFDDVALGVCKTGAEEAGVTEVRTSLSEKKFELWREIKLFF